MACVWCNDSFSELRPVGFASHAKYPAWLCSACQERSFSITTVTFIGAFGHVFGNVVDRESFDSCTRGYLELMLADRKSPINIEVR